MIPGIDVSHWQREIDWAEVKRSGVKFAFIKATEFPDKRTTLSVDEQLQNNIDGASSNGIFWSAYHFFRTHIDPIIQAQVFCETVGEFNSLPPVLDLEVAGSKGERLNYKVHQFLDEVEKITQRRPIIYSSGGFWRSYMMYEKKAHSDWACAYPLWVAQYTSLWPTPLYPWAGWDFWQYTDKGRIPGVITNVDLNWFNGSVEDMQTKFVLNVNSYPNEIEMNYGSEIEPTACPKSFVADESNNMYRGDFQEPAFQMAENLSKNKSGLFNEQTEEKSIDTHQKEEEWIRTYFLQSTGVS